jgi:AcrR family transcriptional regulator
MAQPKAEPRRARLNRDRVLRAAVALADEIGTDALSMRKLAEVLGVVPMALYKHVASKEELVDGMIDIVLGEIEPPPSDVGWKAAIRQRVLAARQSLARHPWASAVIDRRADPTPEMLAYMDSMIGMFLAGGFSIDLTHHALHAMGNRLFGFTPAALNDSQRLDPESLEMAVRQLKGIYPHVAELTQAVYHDAASVVGGGCDDQFEFEFALDLLLDGLERLR